MTADDRWVPRAFYALLFALLAPKIWRFAQGAKAPVEPVEILRLVPAGNFRVLELIAAGVGLAVLLSTFFPRQRVLRAASFFAILAIVAIESSYGKVVHGFYGWLWAALALVFLPAEGEEERNARVILYAQFNSVICYSLSGLWKARAIPSVVGADGWGGFLDSLGNSIAYEHVTYSRAVSPLTQYFLDRDFLTGAMFCGLILLQIFAPLIVMSRRAHLAFGLAIVSFHVLSEAIVGIPFRPQLYLMILFFIAMPAWTYTRRHRLARPRTPA